MTGGQQARLDLLQFLDSAQNADPNLSLGAGFAAIPMTELTTTAFDLRLPLIVVLENIDWLGNASEVQGKPTSLPGRMGDGWPLLERLYGSDHRVFLLPTEIGRAHV